METLIDIEVVFATPDRQDLLALKMPAGTTLGEAILASGIESRFRESAIGDCETGVWGRPASRATILNDGDRVEIYRPLMADPREARRHLATQGQTMGKALKD